MAVKKIEELNIHRDVNSTEQFDVQGYLNENWDKMQDVVDNNAEELMQVQKDISTLKEDNKTNKSSIDVLEKSNETRDGKISKNTEDIEAIQGSIKTATETINKKDNEQDEDIKANKESIEELQAENLEIKAENERLREDIKSIATIGEASGENIHLEDSSDARCELEICGNHQQDTREGYNQFKITSTQTQSAGVTITKIDESSVSYQGTTTGMFTHMLVEYDGKGLEITKQMYLKAFGNLTNAILSVKLIKNGKTESSYLRVSPDLILSAGDVLQQIYVQQQNTGILISGTLQVLLTDYENKDKPYEQYGASPSIDFPSELKAVGDDINILNDTIFARKGYYSGIVGATTQKVNTTIRLLTDEDINVISNKDITISLGTDKDLKYNFFEIDENDVIIKNNMSSNNKDKTIKLQENTKKISLMLMWQDANKTITLEDIKDCKIKIAYGTSINNYSSYNCGSAKVDIVNENIFNTENVKSTSEVSVVDNKNGVLELQGVNGFWKGITTTQKFETGKRVYIKCKYVAGTGSAPNIGIRDVDGNSIVENYKIANYSISCSFISKGITKIFFRCNGTSNNGNIKYYDIMFSYEDIDYIPHQGQSYLVDVQQPMFEGDTFMKQDAKWCEKHNWKTMSFDGQNMASQAGGTFADFKENGNVVRVFKVSDLLISSVRDDILCDKLPVRKDSMWNGKDYGIQTYQNQNNIVISLPYADVEKNYGEELTVDNYTKAYYKYLQDNELTIYYKLAEPVLLECTEAQSKVLDEIYSKAHTYKNITNISAESAEINPIVNVKYLKDTETEHNKLQAQINEIKELLSSTETSALLVNNLEKDLRMEVE